MKSKNLKNNPTELSYLKRKCLITQMIIGFAYNPFVDDVSFIIQKKKQITITLNGVEHNFKYNTPINFIKKYFEKIVFNTTSAKQFNGYIRHKESEFSTQSYLFN